MLSTVPMRHEDHDPLAELQWQPLLPPLGASGLPLRLPECGVSVVAPMLGHDEAAA